MYTNKLTIFRKPLVVASVCDNLLMELGSSPDSWLFARDLQHECMQEMAIIPEKK